MATLNFGDAFIPPDDFKSGVDTLIKAIDKLSERFTSLGNEIDQKATRRVKELREEIAKLPISTNNAGKSLAEYEKQIEKLLAANKKLTDELKSFKEGTEKAKGELANLQKGTKEYDDALKQSYNNLKKKKEGLGELAIRYLRTTVVVTQLYRGLLTLQNGVNAAFDSFVEFEREMQQVRSVTSATDSEFLRLTATAKNLGATTEFTAAQIAGLQKQLAKLGFTTQEIISSTAAITDLATATGEDLGAAARVAASTLRAFNLEASEMDRVTNVMAGSFVRSGLDLEKFSEAMKFVAPNAAALNVDIETTTALLSKFADAGIRGTQGGTALRNIFSDLTSPTSKLAQRLGFTVNSSEELVIAFQKLSKEGIQFSDVARIVDKTALEKFQTILKNVDSVEALQRTYRDLDHEGRRLAAMMRNTLDNDLEILNSSLDALGRSFFNFLDTVGQGEGDLGNFRKSTQSLTGRIQNLTNQFERGDNAIVTLGRSYLAFIALVSDSFFILKPLGELIGVHIPNGTEMLQKAFDGFDIVEVQMEKSKEAILSVVEPMKNVREEIEKGLASGKLTKDSEEFLKLQKELDDYTAAAAVSFDQASSRLDFLGREIKRFTKIQNTEGEELNSTQETNLKNYLNEQRELQQNIEVLKEYGITAGVVQKVLETFTGVPVQDLSLKIAKLKAETDQYVTSLERQGQLQDKTFVDQAKTAKDVSDAKIKAINDELAFRLEQVEVERQVLGKNRANMKIDQENAKAQAAITRERIKLETSLRQIRLRQADLVNRQIIAELNTQIKANQVLKDNTLKSLDDRLVAAKEYYSNLDRLTRVEEDRARQKLQQELDNRQITQEQFQTQLTELEQSFLQQRLENNARHQQELFRLEQESFLQRLQVRQELRDLELSKDRESATQQAATINARMNQMAIERRGLTFMFNERKKLIEEERNLRVKQILDNANLDRRAARGAFDDENIELEQRLKTNQIKQDEYNKLRLANQKEFASKLKTINLQSGTEIEQVNLETAQNIKDSWHDSFVEVVEVVQQAMGSLFSFLSEKRKAELERLQEWEEARLEYVKGNAEAEALVRFEAEQRRKEIARKEAKDARAQALFEIALNTAVGISKAVADGGKGLLLIPILAALGAAQAAAVLATPLPEFYKGTDNAPEGLAKVDERGQELIYRKKRNVLELGSNKGERVTYLDRGDQVFTALQTKRLLKDGSDSIISNNLISDNVNRATSSERMVLKATDEDKIIRGLTSAIKSIPQSETIFDERGVSRRMRKRNNIVQTLNKRYKLG